MSGTRSKRQPLPADVILERIRNKKQLLVRSTTAANLFDMSPRFFAEFCDEQGVARLKRGKNVWYKAEDLIRVVESATWTPNMLGKVG
ncbi:hypothetical protein KQI63_09825 [bacterium]|nr:hypothetical protein [bacterium]